MKTHTFLERQIIQKPINSTSVFSTDTDEPQGSHGRALALLSVLGIATKLNNVFLSLAFQRDAGRGETQEKNGRRHLAERVRLGKRTGRDTKGQRKLSQTKHILLSLVIQSEDGYVHVNHTCPATDGVRMANAVELFINCIVIFVGGPLNLLVLITQVLSNRIVGFNTPALYMTNLVISNLLTVTVLPLVILSQRGQLTVSLGFCKFLSLAYYASCTAGFGTLATIAVDRYRVVNQQHGRPRTLRNAYTVLGMTWVAAVTSGAPAPLFTTVLVYDDVGVSDAGRQSCVMFFDYARVRTFLAALKSLITIIWGVIPVVVMSCFYLFFYKNLQRTAYKRRSRTLVLICVLLLSFLVLQTPYLTVAAFDAYSLVTWELNCVNINYRRTVTTLARVIPNFHCLLNPILYAFVGNDFGNKLRQCARGDLASRRAYARSRQRSSVAATCEPSRRVTDVMQH